MSLQFSQPIKGVLLDLDGTLYVGQKWVPGAIETIQWLNQHMQFRFVTNTTTKNRRQISQRFEELAINIDPKLFFTPGRSAFRWFQTQGTPSILPLVHSNLLEDLEGLTLTDNNVGADFVLMGDMGNEWSVDKLNLGLNALLNGAQLVTLAKNRHFKAEQSYKLDVGAFVSALEFGAGVECRQIFGKPNALFFETALQDMGLVVTEAIMVGDDIESDVLGAEANGLHAILVQTGKFHPDRLPKNHQHIRMISDISRLPAYLEGAQSS